VAQAKEAKKASADAKSKGKGKGKGKHGGAAGDITGPVAVVTGIFLVLFTAIIMATDLSKDRRERAAREAERAAVRRRATLARQRHGAAGPEVRVRTAGPGQERGPVSWARGVAGGISVARWPARRPRGTNGRFCPARQ